MMAKDATATKIVNPVAGECSSSSSSNNCALHLIVTSHGLWQPAYHMNFWSDIFESKLSNVIVLNSITNQMQRSTCGIKTAGERMANEILDYLKTSPSRENIKKISFFSFSAGGLWSHHAAMLLHQQGLFQVLKPQFFITVASPLLGVVYQPSHTTHFWLFRQISNCFTGNCAGCLGGRTVEDLVMGDDNEEPLLLQMSKPNNKYGQCLKSFQCERLSYCNTVNDFSVSFESAGLSWYNPFAVGDLPYINDGKGGDFDLFYDDYDKYYRTNMDPFNEKNITKETLKKNSSCSTCWKTIKEIFLSFLVIFIIFGLWLPIMSTATLGFIVPVIAALVTRCMCWDKASKRNKTSNWCVGSVCCCGSDSLFPFHCLKRWCCSSKDNDISKLWFEMYRNRRMQNIIVVPVSITSNGNAHGKIANRPCCCCIQSWPEGREVAEHIVARMKKFQ